MCLFINYDSVEKTYDLENFQSLETPDTNHPITVEKEIELPDEALYGELFGFSALMWFLPDPAVPFAYRYLRDTDAAYWQITDPDIVWSCTRDNKVNNRMNYAFMF